MPKRCLVLETRYLERNGWFPHPNEQVRHIFQPNIVQVTSENSGRPKSFTSFATGQ